MVRADNGVVSIDVRTDRAGELVRVQRVETIPGLEMWSVSGSDRHWSMHHDTFTACLVLSPRTTRGTWVSRGRERLASPGCVQLMDPGEAHRTTAVTEPSSFFVVHWSPAVFAHAAGEVELRRELRFEEAQTEDPVVADALRRLHAAASSSASDALTMESLYAEATADILERLVVRTPRESWLKHPNVRRALEYLRDCYRENVSLDSLAREAQLSKFHLARCFREAVGLAPHQYQKLLRVQAARRLIENGTPIREAAALVGFADGPHLTRTFREWLGVAPSAWARTTKAV